MEVWESVILLLGYALYIAFMTKNEKVADWIERRRLGGKRVTPGGSEMTRSVSQGPDFKAAIVKDTAMNPRLKPTYHPGHDEKLEQARAGERKKIAMGDAAVTALAVSRLSKTWLNKSRSGGLGGLVAQASSGGGTLDLGAAVKAASSRDLLAAAAASSKDPEAGAAGVNAADANAGGVNAADAAAAPASPPPSPPEVRFNVRVRVRVDPNPSPDPSP